jgi:UDP-N-acetylglucosamine:LPS N-acetylglucosamine transferase
MKLCLVCSSGGHFLQLYSLKDVWEGYERFWVTFQGNDTEFFLSREKVYNAYCPTNRHIKNLVRNSFMAMKILLKEKPDVIISTGAGVAVPFLYAGRVLGIKTIYVESMTRVESLSVTGKLVYPVVHHLLVQWPKIADKYDKAIFKGQVI